MATNSNSNPNISMNFVTRPEFEAFEKSVDNNFAEVRDSIHTIGRKIDNLSSKGVDYKAIFAGVSVLLTVIIAIGGLFGWGLNDKMNATTSIIKDHISSPGHYEAEREQGRNEVRLFNNEKLCSELDINLQREMRLLDERLQAEFKGYYHDINNKLESIKEDLKGHMDHTRGVTEKLIRAEEAIKALSTHKTP